MKSSEAIYREVLEQLQRLIEQAIAQGVDEAHAAALATTDRYAHPSVRMVYIVAVEALGLLFFASTESGKGQHSSLTIRAHRCVSSGANCRNR